MNKFAIVVIVAAAFCVSAVFGASYLTVDDSGVDYTDTDLSKAYLGFDMNGDDVVVILSASSFDGAVGTVDFDVPDLDREDFFGNAINADLANIGDVRWRGVNDPGANAAFLVEVEATHLDMSLADAIDAYGAAMERLGFTVSMSDTSADSVKLVTCTNGSTTLVVRLHSRSGDVIATLNVS